MHFGVIFGLVFDPRHHLENMLFEDIRTKKLDFKMLKKMPLALRKNAPKMEQQTKPSGTQIYCRVVVFSVSKFSSRGFNINLHFFYFVSV